MSKQLTLRGAPQTIKLQISHRKNENKLNFTSLPRSWHLPLTSGKNLTRDYNHRAAFTCSFPFARTQYRIYPDITVFIAFTLYNFLKNSQLIEDDNVAGKLIANDVYPALTPLAILSCEFLWTYVAPRIGCGCYVTSLGNAGWCLQERSRSADGDVVKYTFVFVSIGRERIWWRKRKRKTKTKRNAHDDEDLTHREKKKKQTENETEMIAVRNSSLRYRSSKIQNEQYWKQEEGMCLFV